MADSYIDRRKHENIYQVELPNKKQFYSDLLNIERSWSGRMDANICNTFIMEAEQQLVNAMELFESGYFDCAYYSLRSAVEVSTTMVFLTDMPEEKRREYYKNWEDTKGFPTQGDMINQLLQHGNVFSDMLKKMSDFFSAAKELSAELNKYVHKQGLQHYYVARNHPRNIRKSRQPFVNEFESYLQKAMGVVAVMRLAIDPFPILLMDEEILYRCFDSLTEPYNNDFVEKYIGAETIERYKRTDIYTSAYNSLIKEEKKNAAVFEVMKYHIIDSKNMDEIFSQLHLLGKESIIAVLLVAASKKVVKVYCYNGVLVYFTDRHTNRSSLSMDGKVFLKFFQSENLVNQVYDEAYISAFKLAGNTYFVEHNELLNNDDVAIIEVLVTTALEKMGMIGEIADNN